MLALSYGKTKTIADSESPELSINHQQSRRASLTVVPFSLNVEDGTNNGQWSVSVLYEVPAALVGHWFRIEIGGSTTTFTTVQMQKAGISFVRISPTI